LLIRRTIQKRDEYKEKNDLHNYVKTNAMVCVLIHTMFCGSRAEKEIGDIINTDFIENTNNCSEFQQVTTKGKGSDQTSISWTGYHLLYLDKNTASHSGYL